MHGLQFWIRRLYIGKVSRHYQGIKPANSALLNFLRRRWSCKTIRLWPDMSGGMIKISGPEERAKKGEKR